MHLLKLGGGGSGSNQFVTKSFINSRPSVYVKKSTFTEGTNGKYPYDYSYVDFNDVEFTSGTFKIRLEGGNSQMIPFSYSSFEPPPQNVIGSGFSYMCYEVRNKFKFYVVPTSYDSGVSATFQVDIFRNTTETNGDCLVYDKNGWLVYAYGAYSGVEYPGTHQALNISPGDILSVTGYMVGIAYTNKNGNVNDVSTTPTTGLTGNGSYTITSVKPNGSLDLITTF